MAHRSDFMTITEQTQSIQRHVGTKADGKWGPATAQAVMDRLGISPSSSIDGARHISDRGLELVKHFEGLYLKAYQDFVGVWTIGWGHTGLQHKDGTVFRGREISPEKATELLRYDMHQFEQRVISFVTVPVNDDEFAALVSFDFNTGGLGKSTLLKKLNGGDRTGAADEFLKWDKAGGKVLRGLTRRRQSERNLFLGKTPFLVT
jgi:lysozyme